MTENHASPNTDTAPVHPDHQPFVQDAVLATLTDKESREAYLDYAIFSLS